MTTYDGLGKDEYAKYTSCIFNIYYIQRYIEAIYTIICIDICIVIYIHILADLPPLVPWATYKRTDQPSAHT